jgi:AAA domain
MATPAEQLVISAILRTGDFQTHQAHGITAEHFHDYRTEWDWLETHFQTYGRTPTKTEFRTRFDEFTIKAVDTVALYCAEVQQSHQRHTQLALTHLILSELETGDPDYAANEDAIVRHAGRVSLNGSRGLSLVDRMRPGGSFILDGPKGIPAVWGHGQEVLWAEGEPLVIVGPEGVGKTTVAQQVALARIGIGDGKVLGFPVAESAQRLLYLAGDRPAQVRRSFLRMVEDTDRATLDQRLMVWPGPSPSDFGKHPRTLLDMARAADADTVVVDSLKDVCPWPVG